MTALHHWLRADEDYRYGACAELACALALELGLPMVEIRNDIGAHAVVVDGDDALDIRGRRPLIDVIAEWNDELLGANMGGGAVVNEIPEGDELALAQEWSWYGPANMRRARSWAQRLIACDFQPPHRAAATLEAA